MRRKRQIGDVGAAIMHVRICRDMIRADYAMRREAYGSIPCPLCSHNGTIYYEVRDGRTIVGHCDSAQCVHFG
jgi:hypothetical protein